MAICKMCHKVIPDGRDFCDECETKRTNQADESYLDRLLSSVSSDDEPAPRRNREEHSKDKDDRPSIADLFADVIAEEKENRENKGNTDEPVVESDETTPEDKPVLFDEPALSDDTVSLDEPVISDNPVLFDEPVMSDNPVSFDEPVFDEEPVLVDEPVHDDMPSYDGDSDPDGGLESFGDDPPSEIDSMITDLLSEMPEETPGSDDQGLSQEDIADIFSQHQENEEVGDVEPVEMTEAVDDIAPVEQEPAEPAEPVDTFDAVEPVDLGHDTDLFSVNDTDMVDPFGGEITPSDEPVEPEVQFVNPGEETSEENLLGVDDLFALDDSTISEQDIVSIGDDSEPVNVMAEIESGAFEDKIKALDAPPEDKTTKKKKKSLFQKLFGNVVEELTEEQKEARRQKAEQEEKQKAAILEAKKKSAEEAKAAKAAQKEIDKAEAEEKKKQADEAKRKAKEEAREKARKKKEAREALEISEEDEGRINKVGAGILFILFGIIAAFIILGTNTYTYNLSIENAQTDFLIRHYNEAYYDVYGLTIKDEDIELYDRIMTVMYVNSQLNSYNYYMTSHNNDKALNSLIKGLEKYEKYYMLATTLGITDDLEYVKTNILNELNRTFGLTEEEAYSMMNINDVVDYSEYIYALLGTYDIEALKELK